jgi:hypothetical protein
MENGRDQLEWEKNFCGLGLILTWLILGDAPNPTHPKICQLPTNPHIECELLFYSNLKDRGDWIKTPISTRNDKSRSDDRVVAAGVNPPFIAQH